MDYRLKEMQELKLAGASFKDIADKFSISRQRVQQIMTPSPEVIQAVKERDKSTCQECGEYVGRSGHVHHKGVTNEIDSLLYLCLSCHRKAHRGTISDETRARISAAVLEARYKKYLATGVIV